MVALTVVLTYWINTELTNQNQNLIDNYNTQNTLCRAGDPTEPDTWRACGARDATLIMLNTRGLCFGTEYQAEYEKQWARCKRP